MFKCVPDSLDQPGSGQQRSLGSFNPDFGLFLNTSMKKVFTTEMSIVEFNEEFNEEFNVMIIHAVT